MRLGEPQVSLVAAGWGAIGAASRCIPHPPTPSPEGEGE